MLYYQHRWIYVLFVFVAFTVSGYFYGVHPHRMAFYQLRIDKKELAIQLARYKQLQASQGNSIQSNVPVIRSQSDLLSDLFTLAHLSGLSIQSIRFLDKRAATAMINLHLNAYGDFLQLSSFVRLLAKHANPIVITDFTYKSVGQNQFLLSTDVTIINKNITMPSIEKTRDVFSVPHNPFCVAHEADVQPAPTEQSRLRSVPIHQFRMVGFLHEGQRSKALLAAPNGLTLDVEAGAMIGVEAALVTEVAQDRVVAALPDNKLWIIHISGSR